MRIASGSTDRVIYFVAVDATDLKTRETGLSGFTVYRSRNGGAATAYTTPTVTELSSSNMPGVYALLIDEDTTIGAGRDTEEYLVHVTHASMAPVSRAVELYRPETTEGSTLLVDAAGTGAADVLEFAGVATTTAGDGRPEVRAASIEDGTISANTFLTGAIDAVALATDAVTEIQSGLATAANQSTILAGLSAINADTIDISGRLPAALVSGRMDSSVGAMAAGVIGAAAVAAGAANKLADHVLRRSLASVQASSDGDAVSFRSALGAVRKLVNKWSISGGTLTVYHEDDTTSAGTQTVTTNAAADPITSIDTD